MRSLARPRPRCARAVRGAGARSGPSCADRGATQFVALGRFAHKSARATGITGAATSSCASTQRISRRLAPTNCCHLNRRGCSPLWNACSATCSSSRASRPGSSRRGVSVRGGGDRFGSSRAPKRCEGTELSTAVPANLLLSIDPVLFEQVLINLLENAMKHGAPPVLNPRAAAKPWRSRCHPESRRGSPPGDVGCCREVRSRLSGARCRPGPRRSSRRKSSGRAHGGTVRANNVADGGAVFGCVLPTPLPPATPSTVPAQAAS